MVRGCLLGDIICCKYHKKVVYLSMLQTVLHVNILFDFLAGPAGKKFLKDFMLSRAENVYLIHCLFFSLALKPFLPFYLLMFSSVQEFAIFFIYKSRILGKKRVEKMVKYFF